MNPLVVEWPGTAKTQLEAASQRGLVVVSYQGCVMKVLAACNAGGRYEMKRVTASHERIEIDSEDKLYAELPLGVANLKGYLRKGSRLSLEYVSVGQQVADGEPLGLQGSCEGATHYVRAMTLGAYSLDASADRAAGASAGGVVTGGAETRARTDHLRGSGDLEACKAQPDGAGCGAVLQLSVEVLPHQSGSKTEAGFGRGLGGLATLPTVSGMPELLVGQDLASADPALLRLVQAATRAEKDDSVNAEERRKLWMVVVDYDSKHPFRARAKKRAADWDGVATAEAARIRKAQQVCERNTKDSEKLQELLGLDDDVVPKRQKDSYRREYERAYAPFGEVLKDCDAWRRRAEEPWVAGVLDRNAPGAHHEEEAPERPEAHQAKPGTDRAPASDSESVSTPTETGTALRVPRVSLTFSPIHLVFPIVEVTAEVRVVDHFGIALVGGHGTVPLDYYDSNGNLTHKAVNASEVGGQLGFYPISEFDSLEFGLEVLWVKVSSDDLAGGTVSAGNNGVAIGPMIGYKLITTGGFSGFTFLAQGGAQYISGRAEASDNSGSTRVTTEQKDWIPLLNLNIGWSF